MKKFKKVKWKDNQLYYLNEKDFVSFNDKLTNTETALYINWNFFIINWDLRNEVLKYSTEKEIINIFLDDNLEISTRSELTKQELQNIYNNL